MKMITVKKSSKMKTIKLNKNGKARQPRKTKADMKADQIAKIIAHVSDIYTYALNGLYPEQFQFEELEDMLWKLAR